MLTMRKYLAFLSCLTLLLALPLALPQPSQAAFSITIYFGQHASCSGFGLCKIVIGAARETALGGPDTMRARPATGEASASVEQDKSARDSSHRFLKIEMRTALPEKASVLPVAENVTLDAATSKALGFRRVTLLRGEYKIDYSKNKLGSVGVNVEAHS